jgi:phosphatidylethanolamine/phosphatidyl-N-methylethanolamine N-methyltransferase
MDAVSKLAILPSISTQIIEGLRNKYLFLRRFFNDQQAIGSITPSSSFLAKKMIAVVSENKGDNRQILEIGPGTGPITKHLIRDLRPGDHLDLVELEEQFRAPLEKMIQESEKASQISLHIMPLQRFDPKKEFDHVVSMLPLNSFSPTLVSEIFQKVDTLLNKNGCFSYVEYRFLPSIKLLLYKILGGKQSIDPRIVWDTKAQYLKNKSITTGSTLLNIPPAKVLHVSGQAVS